MNFEDFKDIHKGEEIICIGNGPSLENVSISFLKSRPSFGLNYIVHYNEFLDGFVPTYWVALDGGTMEEIASLPKIPKFVPTRQKGTLQAKGLFDETVIPFDLGNMEHPGGMGYGTTLLAATHIASVHMGASTVYLVGFDCAKAMHSRRPQVKGKTGCPHFYDPELEPKYMGGWCNMFGILDKWLRKRGQKIVNLSHPTMCKSLEQDYFWRLNETGRLQGNS